MVDIMAADASIVLRLELAGTPESIHGRLSTGSDWSMPFAGWLGLAAAIEQAMGSAGTHDAPHREYEG